MNDVFFFFPIFSVSSPDYNTAVGQFEAVESQSPPRPMLTSLSRRFLYRRLRTKVEQHRSTTGRSTVVPCDYYSGEQAQRYSVRFGAHDRRGVRTRIIAAVGCCARWRVS